ncbi:MAG: acyl-CoA dehydrogenase family protein [Thermomicrobiales bacterium]
MTTSLLAPTTTHAPYPKTPRQAEFIDLGARMAEIASQNARQHDRDGSFPSDTFLALRESGFLGLTLPLDEGGRGANPIETMLALEQLARGDGAVGLATTMHLVVIAGLADNRLWPEALLEAFFEEVAGDGALINGLASEPDLGSPSRGGLFATTAEAVDGGWKLNGRKTWSTLSPELTYGIVSASVTQPDGTQVPGQFLVAMDSPGVRIEETWDNLSMRGTGSHDVVLDNVVVPTERQLPKPVGRPGSAVNPWALLTSAVYLGIGTAARDFAVQFAKDRVPSGLGTPIAELQTVQHRVAQMDIQLLQARTVLYQTVETYLDMPPDDRASMAWQFAAAKYTVTNNMITVTDQALRIVGSAGLQRKFPLERYFRDVRAGLGNPPMDDVALTLIGKFALDVS